MKTLVLIICAGYIQLCCLNGQEKSLIPGRSQTKHIIYKPVVQEITSIKQFPDLTIKDFTFIDENKNKIIDADEKNEISVRVVNEGEGIAEAVTLRITTKNPVPGMSFNPQLKIGDVKPGQAVDLKVPVTTDLTLQSGTAEFILEALEKKGFDASPVNVKIDARKFQEPKIRVVDAVFSTNLGGKITLNYPINLKVLVQNIGSGYANDVKAEFLFLKENCVMLGGINSYDLGSLRPGEAVELEFLFTATRRFTEDAIPIKVELNEKYKKFASDTLVSVGLNQSLLAGREVVIEGKPSENYKIEIASLIPEVDRNIPVDSKKFPNKYALIIGNEDYTTRQTGINNEADVIFAERDAEFFKEYVINTLGFDEENVKILKNATSAEMSREVDLISKKAMITPDAEIVFYYAGHGFPDEITNIPYLIPVDVSATNLTGSIRLSDLYRKFESSNAKLVSIYLDACFSGSGRNNELLASRGIRVKPKLDVPPANTIVFSASSGTQSALPYALKQHGIFTYFLLKKLQDTKGNTTYGELADYLKTQVPLQSLKVNEKDQNPEVIFGDNNRENWVNKPLK